MNTMKTPQAYPTQKHTLFKAKFIQPITRQKAFSTMKYVAHLALSLNLFKNDSVFP